VATVASWPEAETCFEPHAGGVDDRRRRRYAGSGRAGRAPGWTEAHVVAVGVLDHARGGAGCWGRVFGRGRGRCGGRRCSNCDRKSGDGCDGGNDDADRLAHRVSFRLGTLGRRASRPS